MNCCRFCNTELTNVFCDLGHQPPSNSFLTKEQLDEPETYYPLKVMVCNSCWLVQLPEIKKAGEIFKEDYPYYSSQSPANVQHAKEYVEMMMERFNPKRVLEIGSNDGYLLQWFKERGCDVLGVDPARGPAKTAQSKGITTLMTFFGGKMIQYHNSLGTIENAFPKHDLICGINVLAHQPYINDFVEGLRIALKPDGVITMEFPHLMRLVEDCQFDTIYHEHYSYFSFGTICEIFHKHGLVVFDVEELPEHGGSLRIYACHDIPDNHLRYLGPLYVEILQSKEYAKGMNTINYYQGFQSKVDKIKSNLMQFLYYGSDGRVLINNSLLSFNGDDSIRPGKIWLCKEPNPSITTFKKGIVVAYGAAAKGNTLLNYCGIRSDLMEFVVDRSPHKQGKYLPGSHIPVVDEEYLLKVQPDYVVILPWNLKAEIMEQLKYIRNWGGQFIIPIPILEVI